MVAGIVTIIRPTQKLLSHLGLEVAEPHAPSDSALGDWYAAPLFVGRQRYALLASERSLLSVVLPLKESRTLVARWRARVAERLDRLGVELAHRDAELGAMAEVVIARTASRRTLGAMNELVRHARWECEDAGEVDAEGIEYRLDTLIYGTIDNECPSDVARLLIEQRYGDASAPRQVYLLKVALVDQPDVWRVIKVSGAHTLHRIHEFIERLFNRYEPHLYAFTVGGLGTDRTRRRRGGKQYMHPFALEDAPFEPGWAEDASRTKVRDLGLREGQEFEYLFDFGQEIRHVIRVEAIVAEGGEALIGPVAVERLGEPTDIR